MGGAIGGIVFVGVILALFGGMAAMLIAKNLIYIAGPNEVLVFSGRSRRRADGQRVGYRVIKGGRGFRWPLIEVVDHIDLTNMIIDVAVTNAYAKGGIPLTVQGVANIKVASHEPLLGNVIERFMGRERKEIIKVAKDTLEGNLRGVLSQLTPEQVNDDKISFAEKLLEEAEHDLSKLGLTLDTLKIQNVSDDVSFLDSIGRKQSAEVIKRARIAEADAKARSTQEEAANNQGARLAEIEAEMQIIRAENIRRIRDAQTMKGALIAEQEGTVKAMIARATADVEVQKARVEQTRRRLLADVIAPAQAEMERAQAEAKGNASKIVEDGKATVAVLDEMIRTWKAGGTSARDIFLMQKLQNVMSSLVDTIEDVKVDKITVLPDAGGGTNARKAVQLVEELKAALGVDLPQLVDNLASPRGTPSPQES